MKPSRRLVGYFGYGSLVNRMTHRTPVVHAVPARLKNHRRNWRPRPDMPGFPAALLTVCNADDDEVDGLLIIENEEHLPAIDAREARYDRHPVGPEEIEILGPMPFDCPVHVYRAKDHVPAHRDPPRILQSYLDAVMQGFLAEHGREGLQRFLARTHGFDFGIHRDRHAPIYPRAISLGAREASLFDGLLKDHGIRSGDD